MERDSVNEHIVLFDGVCNLCNAIVQFIIKRDAQGKFKFAAMQSTAGQALLRKFDIQTTEPGSFAFVSRGSCYLKSSASLQLLKELGGFWKLFYMFIIVPSPIRDAVYTLIARSRYRLFGRRASCMMPTEEIKQRFLD